MSEQLNSGTADFPVVWPHPEDARLRWHLDGHGTTARTPLSCSVTEAVLNGFSEAFAQLGLPVKTRVLNLNGYTYATTVPIKTPPAPLRLALTGLSRVTPRVANWLLRSQMAAANKRQMARLEPLLNRFQRYWEDELLPQNQQQLAFFRNKQFGESELPELRRQLSTALQHAQTMGKLHALATFPAVIAMSRFEEYYREQFPAATPLEALSLLQGFANQTLAGDHALWQLSQQLTAGDPVYEIMLSASPTEVLARLAATPEGQPFLQALQEYLQRFGKRLNQFGHLSEPTWLEAPATAVACLQGYLKQQVANPEAVQASQAHERETAIAAARRQLETKPAASRAHFEKLLATAQQAAGIKEDNHWILQELFYEMRQLALALGKRLAETGALTTAPDVFYLSTLEIVNEALPHQATIEQRRADQARFGQVTPPTIVGNGVPPPISPDGIFFRSIQKADVTSHLPQPEPGQNLVGLAASAGRARGTARLITSLAEADRLNPGDILVTRATTPPWTPLFQIAGAVVTDAGGILSHGAIVAREYGIPAVVGTGQATKVLHDGQLLEVDGSVGTVRIIPIGSEN